MRRRVMRWAALVTAAAVFGLGIVVVSSATLRGFHPTLALAGACLRQSGRLTALFAARTTPFGPKNDDYLVYAAVMDAMFPDAAEFPPVSLVTEWPRDVRPIPGRST